MAASDSPGPSAPSSRGRPVRRGGREVPQVLAAGSGVNAKVRTRHAPDGERRPPPRRRPGVRNAQDVPHRHPDAAPVERVGAAGAEQQPVGCRAPARTGTASRGSRGRSAPPAAAAAGAGHHLVHRGGARRPRTRSPPGAAGSAPSRRAPRGDHVDGGVHLDRTSASGVQAAPRPPAGTGPGTARLNELTHGVGTLRDTGPRAGARSASGAPRRSTRRSRPDVRVGRVVDLADVVVA